jgi:hypothetical protein
MKTVARIPASTRTSRLHGLLSAVALAGALVTAAWTFRANLDFYHDDAYITLRYARNLLAGQGAVWNPGERVQGYTSLLQLGMVSTLGALKVDLWLASRLIGVASFAGLVAMLLLRQWRCFQSEPSDLLWVLPVVLAASCCPMIAWSLAGL